MTALVAILSRVWSDVAHHLRNDTAAAKEGAKTIFTRVAWYVVGIPAFSSQDVRYKCGAKMTKSYRKSTRSCQNM
jgi:hypothetical protein